MSAFADYVNSTAFSLALSGRQVAMLLLIDRYQGLECYHLADLRTLRALQGKGLIEWADRGDGSRGPQLTAPAGAVIDLLKLAGHRLPESFDNCGVQS